MLRLLNESADWRRLDSFQQRILQFRNCDVFWRMVANLKFGRYWNPDTRTGWGLQTDPDKLFVVKHGAEERFTGFGSLAYAESAKKLGEEIFELHNGEWCERKKLLIQIPA